jgi:pyruvate dehydrogenase E1 component subunit alpha
MALPIRVARSGARAAVPATSAAFRQTRVLAPRAPRLGLVPGGVASSTRPAAAAVKVTAGSAAKHKKITDEVVFSGEGDDRKVTVSIPKAQFSMHDCETPPLTVDVTVKGLLTVFRQMNIVRRVEVASDQLYKARAIRGFLHLYNGQEAVACAMREALTSDDHVITAYRCHAHAIECGAEPAGVIAEMLGKSTGLAKGKGGSMHMYHKEGNFHGGNGIVGAQIPVGAGVAFAQKFMKKPGLCLSFYGDGAANQGQAFEAYNMSKLWDLPVVFVTENNKYGMGTAAHRSSADTNYYKRAGYIPGLRFDGMNIFTSIAAFRYAAEWCRTGKGPFMLEAETYRYYGHSMSDPGLSYRSKDEVRSVREARDPVMFLKTFIIEHELMTAAEVKAMEVEIRKDIDEAVKTAQALPEPDEHELYTHVLAEEPYYVRAVRPELSRAVNP